MPEALVLGTLALGMTLFLAAMIPQQPSSFAAGLPRTEGNADDIWLTTLPQLYQNLSSVLTPLGLFQIFYTTWFWLPLAVILFACLIGLLDYGAQLPS